MEKFSSSKKHNEAPAGRALHHIVRSLKRLGPVAALAGLLGGVPGAGHNDAQAQGYCEDCDRGPGGRYEKDNPGRPTHEQLYGDADGGRSEWRGRVVRGYREQEREHNQRYRDPNSTNYQEQRDGYDLRHGGPGHRAPGHKKHLYGARKALKWLLPD